MTEGVEDGGLFTVTMSWKLLIFVGVGRRTVKMSRELWTRCLITMMT